MNRREFVKIIGFVAVSLAMLKTFGLPIVFGNTNPERPNIVFIMADDMGYGDVSCYNPDSKIPTPNPEIVKSLKEFLEKYKKQGYSRPI
jgi:hypothetical protein